MGDGRKPIPERNVVDAGVAQESRRLYREGCKHAGKERWSEALPPFERAFALMPTAGGAFQVSTCLARLGRGDDAIEWLLRAHAINPLHADISVEIASAYRARGGSAEALRYVLLALRADPRHDRAMRMLRWIEEDERRADELHDEEAGAPGPVRADEASAFEEAMRLHHEGWKLVSEGRWESALALFERSFAAAPTVGAACQASRCQRVLGRDEESLTWLLRAAAINPRQADVAVAIAREYESRGDTDGALRYAQQALRANPRHGPAMKMMEKLGSAGGASGPDAAGATE